MNTFGWNFDTTYARLPRTFFDLQQPVPVRDPRILLLNTALAARLGLDAERLNSPEGARVLAGNTVPDGATPLAQAYAGHQFGHFTMLGDGRAILLGEHIAPDGSRFDIQLKGAGRTMFSRSGDGRAAVGPMLREYIISEAMHGLGIPTSRSLAVVATGEHVYRETRLPGAVLTRVAASHIRVGTFQYLAAQEDTQGLAVLTAHTLRRHYPDLNPADNPALALLHGVVDRQADLIARWMLAGFVHGVMNTDNMAVSGETIDYGPCAFMDAYDPATVFSSIDADGRYAYGNQPHVAQWNLARFAETLLPLLDQDENRAQELAEEAIAGFYERFRLAWLGGMRTRLGLFGSEDGDADLIRELLAMLHATHADYTATLRGLSQEAEDGPVTSDPRWPLWRERWQQRLSRQEQSLDEARELMQRSNPAVIARNHLVEAALAAAATGDLTSTHNLLHALADPYTETEANAPYRAVPPAAATPYRTFCGT